MNTPSPLVPQGTVPDSRGKSHIRLAVFSILALHGVLLSTLLIFGCKKAPDQTADNLILEPTNNALTAPPPPNAFAAVPAQELTPQPLPTPTITATETQSPPAVTATPPPPQMPQDTAREHVVLKGDSFYVLAKKYNTTMTAIAQANPGADPTRLKLGQKLVIPAPSQMASAGFDSGAPAINGGDKLHVVKSGENLTVIARRHGVSVKDVQAANSLRTTQIRAGQKLRIPERAATSAIDAIPPLTPASSPGVPPSPPPFNQ